jgi:hypothetical protein
MACYVAEQDMVNSWHAMSLQYRTRESNINVRSTASVDWEALKVILLVSRVREHATELAALAADRRPKDPLLYLSSSSVCHWHHCDAKFAKTTIGAMETKGSSNHAAMVSFCPYRCRDVVPDTPDAYHQNVNEVFSLQSFLEPRLNLWVYKVPSLLQPATLRLIGSTERALSKPFPWSLNPYRHQDGLTLAPSS